MIQGDNVILQIETGETRLVSFQLGKELEREIPFGHQLLHGDQHVARSFKVTSTGFNHDIFWIIVRYGARRHSTVLTLHGINESIIFVA